MTNQGGAACGRCMKACPYNNEGLLVHRALLWIATHFAFSRSFLAKLDDKLGNGDINPVKRWWADLEVVDHKVVKPAVINQRRLDIAKADSLKGKQKIAYINADMLPPPNWKKPFPLDRKAAVAAAQKLETLAQARERVKRGGPKPAHYVPPPPIEDIKERSNTS
jgi:ferredoxin